MSFGCNIAKAGTQEAVFCQVQKFPRIVVIPKAYGYLETLELNPCVPVGKTNQPCGFGCCADIPDASKRPAPQPKSGQPYNPNPPFPFVPPAEQIACYNLRSSLNTCNVNKRNFYINTNSYNSVLGPST